MRLEKKISSKKYKQQNADFISVSAAYFFYQDWWRIMQRDLLIEIEQSGRILRGQEIAEIIKTVETFQNLSLRELIETICEHLEWYTATG